MRGALPNASSLLALLAQVGMSRKSYDDKVTQLGQEKKIFLMAMIKNQINVKAISNDMNPRMVILCTLYATLPTWETAIGSGRLC